jgi:hypothetical protein
MVDIADLKSAL